MNNDNKQTATNFNQTYHDINELKKNPDLTKSKEFANTANDRKTNPLMNSGDKTIEM